MDVPENVDTMTAGELSDDEMRQLAIDLAFNGDQQLFNEFCDTIVQTLPENTAAVLRGSAITGKRWSDGAPFDADGPGTSDLDLTLVGDEIISYYSLLNGFFVPGIHSKPLSDEDPDIAPDLVPLRKKLMAMVNRPVNIQATRDFVAYIREYWIGQPHLTLCAKGEGSGD